MLPRPLSLTAPRLRPAGSPTEGGRSSLASPQGFSALRAFMAAQRATENIDFVSDAMSFKAVEDIASTKDVALRIQAKFIEDRALAQVFLPPQVLEEIKEGLQPRFPSAALFDHAVDHILGFMQQELWLNFKMSQEYLAQSSRVLASITYGPKPALLSLRVVGSSVRHVVHVFHRIVTVGTSRDCDVVVKEGGHMKTSVLRIEPEADGGGALVTLLWSCSNRKGASVQPPRKAVAASPTPSSSGKERTRGVVIANNTPCHVRYGEAFLAGDYEGMVLGP